ncbi:MAG: hypothetical protein QM737_21095 [Ferruginibacter sp.]
MKTKFKNFVSGKLAFLFLISIISFSSCKKESVSKQPDPVPVVTTTTDVYAGGYERSAAGFRIAKTWKNGVATTLSSDGDDAWVESLVVSGADVYAVGVLIQGGNNTGHEPKVAKLWKNSVDVPILASGDMVYGHAYSVFVSGSDLYIAGTLDSVNNTNPYAATLWKNGVPTTLSNSFGDAISVFVSGTDVYVTGDEYNPANLLWEPKYWKNGVAHLMPLTNTSGNDHVGQIVVSGNDIYIAGTTESTNPYSFATLWKNDVATNFTDGTGHAGTVGVAVSGSDVYVAGWDITPGTNNAILKVWKNGVATDINTGTNVTTCLGMSVSGEDVYVGGGEWQNNLFPNMQAVVWKNGTPTYLTDGTYQSTVYSVFANTY